MNPKPESNPIWNFFVGFNESYGINMVILIVIIILIAFLVFNFYRQWIVLKLNLRKNKRGIRELEEKLKRRTQTLGSINLKNSIAKRLYDNCFAIRRLPNSNIKNILDLLVQQETDRVATLRNLPNTLLMLGMSGTVLGLILSVLNFDINSISSEDINLMTSFVKEIIGGLQLAFFSTFVGIVSAIIVSFLLRNLEKGNSLMFADLEKLAINELAPKMFPTTVSGEIDKLREVLIRDLHGHLAVLQDSKTIFGEYARTIQSSNNLLSSIVKTAEVSVNSHKAMMDDLEKFINLIGQNNNSNSEKVLSSVSELSSQLYEHKESQRNTVQNGLNDVKDQLRDHTNRTQITIQKNLDSILSFKNDLQTQIKNEHEANQQRLKNIEDKQSTLENTLSSFTPTIESNS